MVRTEVVTRIRKHWLVVIVDRPSMALTAFSAESNDEEEDGDSNGNSEDSNTSESSDDDLESEEENDDVT